MSSIVSNMNAERNNRWLLIGALALAVIAGVLIFAALANFNDDEGSSASVATGDKAVLVTKENVPAGTILKPDMFRTATYADNDVINGALSDPEAVIGVRTATELQKGQQLSKNFIVQGESEKVYNQLAFKIPEGHVGYAIAVNDEAIVGGLLIPGDRVNVIATITEKRADTGDQKYVRIRQVLQNVEVLAVAKTPVEGVTTLNDDGTAATTKDDAGNPDVQRRPEEIEGSAGTITLALTPQQVMDLQLNDHLGDIKVALKPFGDDSETPVQDLVIPVFDN